ncbi:MAG: insulinase family protein [Bacteroidetes bacterium]|nr:insulinase family protein [Bacteroidota bacterium]
MKKLNYIVLLLLAATTLSSSAQDEIKKRPIKKQDMGVKELMVDGIKVIYKPSTKDIVSVALYVKGGTGNYSKEQEGIESLTMNVLSESGTQKYPHDIFHSMLEGMGTTISAGSGLDASTVSMNCLISKWNESWDLFADMIMHPAFDENTFKNKKDEALNALKQTESDPDAHIDDLVNIEVYKGTNYNKMVSGTEGSLTKLSVDDLKKYYSSLIAKNKLFVVIVGKMSEDDIKAKVSMLKRISVGSSSVATVEKRPDFASSSLFKEERKLATNYIKGIMDCPAPGSVDYVAYKLAIQILSDRLFVEIRTKRNLSYAPYSYVAGHKNPYSCMYVSTTDPAQAVQVMTDEVKKIHKNGFDPKELADKKEQYLTRYYMNLETNSALATTIGDNENLSTWKNATKVLDEVQKLKVEDINTAFNKYTKAIRWLYLGETAGLDESIFTQKLD